MTKPFPLTESRTFTRAILASPKDPAPREVYADWLEENGFDKAANRQRVYISVMKRHDELLFNYVPHSMSKDRVRLSRVPYFIVLPTNTYIIRTLDGKEYGYSANKPQRKAVVNRVPSIYMPLISGGEILEVWRVDTDSSMRIWMRFAANFPGPIPDITEQAKDYVLQSGYYGIKAETY